MSCPRPHLRFSPVFPAASSRHPHVLLVGSHQPHLLRYLDGWPKHWAGARNFLIRFAGPQAQSLQALPTDSFDLVVVSAESLPVTAELVGQLVRVARQGLISLR
ncbi:class I SAM-dependent methyltransferase [Aquipseudomonas ullengensis]|uniref:Class I SAM-dependent methyltransferase n=1 Tax=Aquipseudomonas ullengensis TaxID=2759166 RepID=A0A7W4LMW6_9GAMM|nr:class I SAM-dependent methyltransferase [Pseudomonas ullengensis]MBB2496084.1 class I SAM-dependent methyltransferase [Pseudomonas ullengensis]